MPDNVRVAAGGFNHQIHLAPVIPGFQELFFKPFTLPGQVAGQFLQGCLALHHAIPVKKYVLACCRCRNHKRIIAVFQFFSLERNLLFPEIVQYVSIFLFPAVN